MFLLTMLAEPTRVALAVGCSSSWSIAASVDPSVSDELHGATALTIDDAWTVGADYQNGLPLAEHWDGSTWSQVSAQAAPTPSAQFDGVSGSSPTDLWAVGNYISNKIVDGSHVNKTLIEHSTGGAWSRVRSPNTGSRLNELSGVVAVSSTDAWAVGSRIDPNHEYRTLVEHWDGSAWGTVTSPNRGPASNYLFAVAGTADDLWAVGEFVNQKTNASQVLIEHYDGSTWSTVGGKNPSASSNALDGVVALSPTNAWAVGSFTNSQFVEQTLAEHFNGTSWRVVSTPNPVNQTAQLKAVAALSSTDVWAVGSSRQNGPAATLVEQMDVNGWHIVASPNVSTDSSALTGAAAVAGAVWAVGSHTPLQPQTLIEQACGV